MNQGEGVEISQRALRVAALKASIQNGTYHVPASDVAGAIVKHSIEHAIQVGLESVAATAVRQKLSRQSAPAHASNAACLA